MKITIECNSIQELRDFCFESGYLVSEDRIKKAEAATKASGEIDDSASVTIATAEPKEEPVPAAEEAPTEEAISIVDLRKLLKIANDKAGHNIAKELIKAEGYDSLNKVTDQEARLRIKAKAEEVINAG